MHNDDDAEGIHEDKVHVADGQVLRAVEIQMDLPRGTLTLMLSWAVSVPMVYPCFHGHGHGHGLMQSYWVVQWQWKSRRLFSVRQHQH